MYAKFFGLKQEPFSIAPDPRYLFMSERHREALAHLLYGLDGGGGFVLLSGEIGAGKTTVCRCFLEQIPRRCNVAYIFNPKLTVDELLKTVCEEFRIPVQHEGAGVPTVKDYLDPLNEYLLRTHAVGQNNVLIIDEAQMLSVQVLEQLRLLTNLETSERKLLQIILIGQPELRAKLAQPELEQLGQRVIARFHLEALTEAETMAYIRHRLTVAGLRTAMPFDRASRRRIHQLSRGVPRRINLLCDRALLGAYAEGRPRVEMDIVEKAAVEVFGKSEPPIASPRFGRWALAGGGVLAGAALFGVVSWALDGSLRRGDHPAQAPALAASAVAAAPAAPASAASAPLATAVAASAMASAPVPAPQAAPLVLAASELKTRFQPLLRNEKDAWRDLAPGWKLTLGEGDPCQAAAQQQVQCFRSNGGLGLIRQLSRPSVLTLRDENDKPVYAVLTALNEQGATLRMGAAVHTISLGSLASMWRGDFATFWRAPPGYVNPVAPGQSGPVVEHLASQLAALTGDASLARHRTLDTTLKAKVYAFQIAQGLKADGMAGATTFMQLNRLTGVDEPRLMGEPASN